MLIAILVILMLLLTVDVLIMLLLAVVVSNTKPKSVEQAQADLFEAWGDSVINNYKN